MKKITTLEEELENVPMFEAPKEIQVKEAAPPPKEADYPDVRKELREAL